MALQCFRKAVEIDFPNICALYQSLLIFRRQGNTQAEIQMLGLLHSVGELWHMHASRGECFWRMKIILLPQTLMSTSTTEPGKISDELLSWSVLLRSQALRRLLSVPTALCVLHSLAQKCVLNSRFIRIPSAWALLKELCVTMAPWTFLLLNHFDYEFLLFLSLPKYFTYPC